MSDPDVAVSMPLVAANVTIASPSEAPPAPTMAGPSAAATSPAKRRLDEQTRPDPNSESNKRIRYTDTLHNQLPSGPLALQPLPPPTPPPQAIFDAALKGKPVNRHEFRRAGPYILGQRLSLGSVEPIEQYLAKREGTDDFVLLKMLTMCDRQPSNIAEQLQEHRSMVLLHAELSMLSLLVGQPGVIQLKGWFKDTVYEEKQRRYTGRVCPRVVLVLESVWPHDFSDASHGFVNLQQVLVRVKRMSDRVALPIFRDIVGHVEALHRRNIIHRDMKLGNVQLHRPTNRTILINFAASRLLHSDGEPMHDQRGSPAYISPEVLSGQPFTGKPIDMWSLGVMLYMMVVGQLPFYEPTPTQLFQKIKAADFKFPTSPIVSPDTQLLIRGMLHLNPAERLTATAVRQTLDATLAVRRRCKANEQTVPLYEPPKRPSAVGRAAPPQQSLIVERPVSEPDAAPGGLPGLRQFRLSDEQLVPDMDAPPNPARVRARIRRRTPTDAMQPPAGDPVRQPQDATAAAQAIRRLMDARQNRSFSSERLEEIAWSIRREQAARRTAETGHAWAPDGLMMMLFRQHGREPRRRRMTTTTTTTTAYAGAGPAAAATANAPANPFAYLANADFRTTRAMTAAARATAAAARATAAAAAAPPAAVVRTGRDSPLTSAVVPTFRRATRNNGVVRTAPSTPPSAVSSGSDAAHSPPWFTNAVARTELLPQWYIHARPVRATRITPPPPPVAVAAAAVAVSSGPATPPPPPVAVAAAAVAVSSGPATTATPASNAPARWCTGCTVARPSDVDTSLVPDRRVTSTVDISHRIDAVVRPAPIPPLSADASASAVVAVSTGPATAPAPSGNAPDSPPSDAVVRPAPISPPSADASAAVVVVAVSTGAATAPAPSIAPSSHFDAVLARVRSTAGQIAPVLVLQPEQLTGDISVGAVREAVAANRNGPPYLATVRQLFQAVNETFVRGQLPMRPGGTQQRPFDGHVTAEFSAAVGGWLLDAFADNALVATTFGGGGGGGGGGDADAVDRVCGFLTSCGVVHSRDEGGRCVLRGDQPLEVRIFMTLMLKAIGFSASLFGRQPDSEFGRSGVDRIAA